MKLFFLGFPRMDNPIVTLHPQSNVCWLCEHYLKSKEKASTITSVGFKTLIKSVGFKALKGICHRMDSC